MSICPHASSRYMIGVDMYSVSCMYVIMSVAEDLLRRLGAASLLFWAINRPQTLVNVRKAICQRGIVAAALSGCPLLDRRVRPAEGAHLDAARTGEAVGKRLARAGHDKRGAQPRGAVAQSALRGDGAAKSRVRRRGRFEKFLDVGARNEETVAIARRRRAKLGKRVRIAAVAVAGRVRPKVLA